MNDTLTVQEAPGCKLAPQLLDCPKSVAPEVTPIPFTVAVLLPVFVIVMDCVAAELLTFVAGKTSCEGLTDKVVVGTTAVPLTAKAVLEPTPLTVKLLLNVPAEVGAKITVAVHDAPPTSVVGQLLLCEYGAPMSIPVMLTASCPTLVIVVLVEAVEPKTNVPNELLLGDASKEPATAALMLTPSMGTWYCNVWASTTSGWKATVALTRDATRRRKKERLNGIRGHLRRI